MRFNVCRALTRVALAAALLAAGGGHASAQPGILTRELLIKYTPDWTGERFADGRPRVADGILERATECRLVLVVHAHLRVDDSPRRPA